MLPYHEMSLLWQYLDGVSSAMASMLHVRSDFSETSLTDFLTELLDDGQVAARMLDYSPTRLREDMAKSTSAFGVEVRLDTHKHTTRFEADYSNADLGIHFSYSDGRGNHVEKGFLFQAKRLFPETPMRGQRTYTLNSEYASFDHDQLAFLEIMADVFGASGIFYLWYNPKSDLFPEYDARALRAIESRGFDESDFMLFNGHIIREPFWHLAKLPLLTSHEKADLVTAWRLNQPAMRLSDFETVLKVAGNSIPTLRDFYSEAGLPRLDNTSFMPFANFIFNAITNSSFGSDDKDFLELVRGNAKPFKVGDPSKPPKLKKLPEVFPPPRHTLKIDIRSMVNFTDIFRPKE